MSHPRPNILQGRLQSTVLHLHKKVKESKEYNQKIFRKYHVKKYEVMDDEHKEPVEVWIFDSESKYIPIIEDQALKRVQSISEAARLIFKEQKCDETMIDKSLVLFEKAINQILDSPSLDDKTFETQFKQVDRLIHQFINDLTYYWGHTHPSAFSSALKLTEKDYANFNQRLWDAIEQVEPRYKKSNILVMNTDPRVRSVQYYQRGAITLTSDKKEKTYQSSHNRSVVGLPNFIKCGAGHLENGEPVITQVELRHASLPPIGLYKKERKDEELHPQCVAVTTRNIEALCEEMRQISHKNSHLNWINVSLLTVTNDDEKQQRQYEETILSADRIRSRYNGFNPITFDFGVNWAALGWIPTYPKEQKFENHRAFFQLQKIFFEKLKSIYDDKSEDPYTADIKKLIENFFPLAQYFQYFIDAFENSITVFAGMYDQACKEYEKEQSQDNFKKMMRAKQTLNKKKVELHQKVDEYVAAYKKTYEKIFPNLKKHYNLTIGKLKDKDISPSHDLLIFLLFDFIHINELYLSNTWSDRESNFSLQARIIDFGSLLGQLDNYYVDKSNSQTFSSFNCKSNNDRSATLAAYVDSIRAWRIIPHLNLASHYMGNACAMSAVYDTDGGGSKFGAHFYDSGHPVGTFAEKQEITSKWATHKLSKTYLHSTQIPKGLELAKMSAIAELKLQLREMYRTTIGKYSEKIQDPAFFQFLQITLPNKIDMLDTNYFNKHQFIANMINDYLKLIHENKKLQHEDIERRQMLHALMSFCSVVNTIPEAKQEIYNIDKDILKQVKTYEGWRLLINSGRRLCRDSEYTEHVDLAYKDYFRNRDLNPVQRMNQLANLKSAIINWLEAKHGGSQYQKQESSTQSGSEPKLRNNSRQPAMVAILQHVNNEIQQLTLEYLQPLNEAFLSGQVNQARALLGYTQIDNDTTLRMVM